MAALSVWPEDPTPLARAFDRASEAEVACRVVVELHNDDGTVSVTDNGERRLLTAGEYEAWTAEQGPAETRDLRVPRVDRITIRRHIVG